MAITKTDIYNVQAPFLLDDRNSKADLPSRDAIGTFQRAQGLLCFTISEKVLWLLAGGTSNSDWVQVWPAVGTIQNAIVNSGAPTGGNDGDMWFRQQGETLTIYQRVSGSWTPLGNIQLGSVGITATLNNSLDPFGETSASLDTTYPNAKVGDIVYTETGQTKWEKLAAGKWTRTSLDIV